MLNTKVWVSRMDLHQCYWDNPWNCISWADMVSEVPQKFSIPSLAAIICIDDLVDIEWHKIGLMDMFLGRSSLEEHPCELVGSLLSVWEPAQSSWKESNQSLSINKPRFHIFPKLYELQEMQSPTKYDERWQDLYSVRQLLTRYTSHPEKCVD